MKRDWHKFYHETTPTEINLGELNSIATSLERACKKYATKTALTCLDTDITYRELDRLATNLASYFQNVLRLEKGTRIALMLPNIIQFPVCFFAAQKAGLICVNTNPLYTPREMEHQFKDSGAEAIIIIDLFTDQLEKIIKNTSIKHVITTSIGDQFPLFKGIAADFKLKYLDKKIPKHGLNATPLKKAIRLGSRKKFTPVEIFLDDLAILQYTGGTTGVSKGAMLSQENILANMEQIRSSSAYFIKEGEESVLTALPLYHIFALSVNFLAFLAQGQRMILVPKPIPVDNIIQEFAKYNITCMTGVNTLFNGLINNSKFKQHPPKNLKIALGGGMAVQSSVSKKWQNLTGLPIVEGFGLTEASPVTHINPFDGNLKLGSIGIPVPSTDAKVVDPKGHEVAHGEVGELVIRGPQVMLGYWKRPDETKKTIKNDWLWTGDMAKRDKDGFFFIVDRKKDMILVSGFNVFPNEVEDVLTSHPKVLEAAVIGVEDKKSGEAVKAYIVAKDKSLKAAELKKHCTDQLTGYKRPRTYVFVDELPKSNVGKILRKELRKLEQKPGAAE